MVSEPRTSDRGLREGSFVPTIGRDAAARLKPRGALIQRAGLGRHVGHLARSSTSFGRRLGLSQVNRWRLEPTSGAAGSTETVRPPIDYWPFRDDDGMAAPAAASAPIQRTVDLSSPVATRDRQATNKLDMLKRLLKEGPKAADGAAATPIVVKAAPQRPSGPIRRGLPMTALRKGRTWAGPGTAPGGMARGSAPDATAAVPTSRFEPADSPGPAARRAPDTKVDRLRQALDAQRCEASNLAPGSAATPSPAPKRPAQTLRRAMANMAATERVVEPDWSVRQADQRRADRRAQASAAAELRATPRRQLVADVAATRASDRQPTQQSASAPTAAPNSGSASAPTAARNGGSASPVARSERRETTPSVQRSLSPVSNEPDSASTRATSVAKPTESAGDRNPSATPVDRSANAAVAAPAATSTSPATPGVRPSAPIQSTASTEADAPASVADSASAVSALRPAPLTRADVVRRMLDTPIDRSLDQLPGLASDAPAGAVPSFAPAPIELSDAALPVAPSPAAAAALRDRITQAEPIAARVVETQSPLRPLPRGSRVRGPAASPTAPVRAVAARAAGLDARTDTIHRSTTASTIQATANGSVTSGVSDAVSAPAASRTPGRTGPRALQRSLDGRSVQWAAATASDATATGPGTSNASALTEAADGQSIAWRSRATLMAPAPLSMVTVRPAPTPVDEPMGDVSVPALSDLRSRTMEAGIIARQTNDAASVVDVGRVAPPVGVPSAQDIVASPLMAADRQQDTRRTAVADEPRSAPGRSVADARRESIRRSIDTSTADVASAAAMNRTTPSPAPRPASTPAGSNTAAGSKTPAGSKMPAGSNTAAGSKTPAGSNTAVGSTPSPVSNTPIGRGDAAGETSMSAPAQAAATVEARGTSASRGVSAGAIPGTARRSWVSARPGGLLSSSIMLRRAWDIDVRATAGLATTAWLAPERIGVDGLPIMRTYRPMRALRTLEREADHHDPAGDTTVTSTIRRPSEDRRSIARGDDLLTATRPARTSGIRHHDVSGNDLVDRGDTLTDRMSGARARSNVDVSRREPVNAALLADVTSVRPGPVVQRFAEDTTAPIRGDRQQTPPSTPGAAPRSGRSADADTEPEQGVRRGDRAARRGRRGGSDRPEQPPRPTTSSPDLLADLFIEELARHRHERPKALPVAFRPIAEVIVGDRKPLISTSEASRHALAAVGKVAATTGDVIHLALDEFATAPSARAELQAVIAHELHHVANPSPAPRFFDDGRHSAEEQRAHEIGELMRSAPLVPRVAPASIMRTTSPDSGTRTSSSSSSTDSVSAADLAARIGGGSPPSISRSTDRTIRRTSADTFSGPPQTIRRALDLDDRPTSRDTGQSEYQATPTMSKDEFARLLRANMDLVVELIEDRVITEIERRGGRFRGDF